MRSNPLYAILFWILIHSSLFGAAYTATVTGNWSAQATWGGSGPPGNGDTVDIRVPVTLDSSVTIGTSGIAGTIAILVDATGANTGSLTMANGTSLTVRGDTRLADAVLTMGSGCSYIFGNGGSAQVYQIKTGSTTGQTNSRIVSNGTSIARNTFTKESGAGNGIISINTNGATVYGGITASYTDFIDMGSATQSFGNWAIGVNPNGANQEAHFDNCTFDRCGTINVMACPNNRNIYFDKVKITRPLNAFGTVFNVLIAATAATTGQRNLTNIDANDSYVGFSTSRTGFTIEKVSFNRWVDITSTAATSATTSNILVSSASGAPNTFGTAGETCSNILMFMYPSSAQSSGMINTTLAGSGSLTLDNVICESTVNDEEIDWYQAGVPASGGPWTYNFRRWLILPNSRGLPSGNLLSAHGSASTKFSIEHCTIGTHENQSASQNAHSAVHIGVQFAGKAAMVESFRSNLIWAPATLASRGRALHYHGLSDIVPSALSLRGTAAATSTSTRIDCTGKTWPTATNQTFLSSAAIAVITAQRTAGPPVGETRTISSNTGNSFTVSSAWSATPDNGTDFVVVVVDVATASNVGYNGLFNVRNGIVYDSIGGSGITKKGYDGFCQTSPSTIGTNDVDLGSGSNYTTAGPEFVDTGRRIDNFASAYLGPAGLVTTPSDWVTGIPYVYGNRVKANTVGWFGDEVLWYRCIVDHTSESTTKPGSGASWRTNWEFDSIDKISSSLYEGLTITDSTIGVTSGSYIQACLEWIRKGYAPRASSLRNAGHDGATIGAVPSPFSPAVIYHQLREQGIN
jgi:hypothetical protein